MRAAEQAAAQARAASTLAARAQARAAEAAVGLQEASDRAQSAVSRLHDVASGTVPVLVTMIDLKDRYTARHSAVVARYARLLAEEIGWSPEAQALAHMTGLVHDIGKVGMPDELLRKPAPPTEPEAELIRCHPDWGADALAGMALFPQVVDGVRSHHERWDGSGYPRALAGVEIPVLGRLIAVADSYEAMIAQRPFREPMDAASARDELAREAGRLYDPKMVDAFLAALERLADDETRSCAASTSPPNGTGPARASTSSASTCRSSPAAGERERRYTPGGATPRRVRPGRSPRSPSSSRSGRRPRRSAPAPGCAAGASSWPRSSRCSRCSSTWSSGRASTPATVLAVLVWSPPAGASPACARAWPVTSCSSSRSPRRSWCCCRSADGPVARRRAAGGRDAHRGAGRGRLPLPGVARHPTRGAWPS